MNKKILLIISLVGMGSLSGIIYATGTTITNTSISTPTLNAVNVIASGDVNASNISVSGSCTGCGGEGDYSSYNIIALNTTVSTSSNVKGILIGNDGGIIASGLNKNYYIALNGTTLFLQTGYGDMTQSEISQSLTGEYKIIIDGSGNGAVNVYKNGMFIQTLGINLTQFLTGTFNGAVGIAMSPNGEYIAVVGLDSSGSNNIILIFQGS